MNLQDAEGAGTAAERISGQGKSTGGNGSTILSKMANLLGK
ncbi:hypothetical protein [Methanosarcina acetivorans]|nr:hypothetical protein [Methanosarcina acetivorans]